MQVSIVIVLNIIETYSQIYGLFMPQDAPVPLSDTFKFVLLSEQQSTWDSSFCWAAAALLLWTGKKC